MAFIVMDTLPSITYLNDSDENMGKVFYFWIVLKRLNIIYKQ